MLLLIHYMMICAIAIYSLAHYLFHRIRNCVTLHQTHCWVWMIWIVWLKLNRILSQQLIRAVHLFMETITLLTSHMCSEYGQIGFDIWIFIWATLLLLPLPDWENILICHRQWILDTNHLPREDRTIWYLLWKWIILLVLTFLLFTWIENWMISIKILWFIVCIWNVLIFWNIIVEAQWDLHPSTLHTYTTSKQ